MPPDDTATTRHGSSSCAGHRSSAPASPPARAAELAARVEVPLQDTLQLVKAGFRPDVAFQMRTSSERPVF